MVKSGKQTFFFFMHYISIFFNSRLLRRPVAEYTSESDDSETETDLRRRQPTADGRRVAAERPTVTASSAAANPTSPPNREFLMSSPREEVVSSRKIPSPQLSR